MIETLAIYPWRSKLDTAGDFANFSAPYSGGSVSRVLPNPHKIQHKMTTTALGLEGYRVVDTLGVVLGITVRSRSIIGFALASFETIRGGRIKRFIELCERTRAEAFELMLQHAEQHGANGVVAIRYDATEVMQGVTEVLCYGTAVILEPE